MGYDLIAHQVGHWSTFSILYNPDCSDRHRWAVYYNGRVESILETNLLDRFIFICNYFSQIFISKLTCILEWKTIRPAKVPFEVLVRSSDPICKFLLVSWAEKDSNGIKLALYFIHYVNFTRHWWYLLWVYILLNGGFNLITVERDYSFNGDFFTMWKCSCRFFCFIYFTEISLLKLK